MSLQQVSRNIYISPSTHKHWCYLFFKIIIWSNYLFYAAHIIIIPNRFIIRITVDILNLHYYLRRNQKLHYLQLLKTSCNYSSFHKDLRIFQTFVEEWILCYFSLNYNTVCNEGRGGEPLNFSKNILRFLHAKVNAYRM